MLQSRSKQPQTRRPRAPAHAWESLSDDELLSLKFRDLKLKIAGTDLEEQAISACTANWK